MSCGSCSSLSMLHPKSSQLRSVSSFYSFILIYFLNCPYQKLIVSVLPFWFQFYKRCGTFYFPIFVDLQPHIVQFNPILTCVVVRTSNWRFVQNFLWFNKKYKYIKKCMIPKLLFIWHAFFLLSVVLNISV